MRIFPFYIFPGWYRGMILIDGCFSGMWSVPSDADESKVLRISPFPIPGADVRPDLRDAFSAGDVLYSRWRHQIFEEMLVGFRCCKRAHDKIVEKGVPCIRGKEGGEAREGRAEEGSEQHMVDSATVKMEEFQLRDPRKTKF